jgi:hypothetical protein
LSAGFGPKAATARPLTLIADKVAFVDVNQRRSTATCKYRLARRSMRRVISLAPRNDCRRRLLPSSPAFREANMGAIILWLLGIPLPIILLFLLLAR